MRDDKKERMNNHILSFFAGKYEIIRTLGSGSYSTVFLVRHQVLELEQAIKVIPKTHSDQLSVLSEARLLKSVHHPGIPMIYDIEEDDMYFYLVEEYICGESLESFLLNQPIISPNLFFSICRQLCDIFIYLHTFLPIPVLYQDLKPEHIILCGEQVKLIDFGVSSYVANSGNNFKHYGNALFSAPENFSSVNLSTAADVYSLGKLFQFLSEHVEPPLSRTVSKIIQTCIHSDPAFRYETVEALLSDLEDEFLKLRSTHLVQNIAVVGSHHGCGVTHFSIALVSTLNLLSGNCYYIEENDGDSIRKLSMVNHAIYEKDGCFYFRCFQGFPKYGPGISVSSPKDCIRVTDYGSSLSDPAIEQADLILFLCDDAPWHWKDAIEQNDFLHTHKDILRIIVNPGNQRSAHFYAKAFGIPVYPFFVDKDAFCITSQKIDYFRRLLNMKGKHSLCLALRRFLLPLRRR
jgi:serine/threonine-protein kinase